MEMGYHLGAAPQIKSGVMHGGQMMQMTMSGSLSSSEKACAKPRPAVPLAQD